MDGTAWIGTFKEIKSFDGENRSSKRNFGDCYLVIRNDGLKCFGFYNGGVEKLIKEKVTFYNTAVNTIPFELLTE